MRYPSKNNAWWLHKYFCHVYAVYSQCAQRSITTFFSTTSASPSYHLYHNNDYY